MSYSEADTRSNLIDPKLYKRGWTEDHIKREESAGTIFVINGKGKQKKGKTDYTLRLKVSADTQPVAVAIIEAKAEKHAPTDGLEQAKLYGAAKRLNVQFVYATNGHLFVEFNRKTQTTSAPRKIKYTAQNQVAEKLNTQRQEVETLKQSLTAQLAAINKLPAALLRKAFAGEL